MVGRVEPRLLEEDDRDDRGDEDPDPEDEPPGPRAAPVDDVLLLEARVVGAEEARPRDQTADDEVEEPAEAEDHEDGAGDRPSEAQVVFLADEEVRRRADEDGDV